MLKGYWTIVRALMARDDSEHKPDGFFFTKKSAFSLGEMKVLLDNSFIRKHLPQQNILASAYHSKVHPDEYRMVITRNSFWMHPLRDSKSNYLVLYSKDEKWNQFRYEDVLNQCYEIYRAIGCQECPKAGRQCMSERFNLAELAQQEEDKEQNNPIDNEKAWPFVYPFSRAREQQAIGLMLPDTESTDKFCAEHSMELDGTVKEFIEKSKNIVLQDFIFADPAQTHANEEPINRQILRPVRGHKFNWDILETLMVTEPGSESLTVLY